MTTAVALGLMLAFEPREPGIMMRPPRDPGQSILTGVLIERIVLVSALMLAWAYGVFLWELERTDSIVAARTAAVNVFVMAELFYLFNCRSLERTMFHVGLFSNPWIWRGVGAMTVLQLLLTSSPAMNRLFHTTPVDGPAWRVILAAAVTVYVVVEVETWLRLQWNRRAETGVPTGRGPVVHPVARAFHCHSWHRHNDVEDRHCDLQSGPLSGAGPGRVTSAEPIVARIVRGPVRGRRP